MLNSRWEPLFCSAIAFVYACLSHSTRSKHSRQKKGFFTWFREKNLATDCLYFDFRVEARSFVYFTVKLKFFRNRSFFLNFVRKKGVFSSFFRPFSTKHNFWNRLIGIMILTSQDRLIQLWFLRYKKTRPLTIVCEKFKFSETRFLGFSHKECIAALLPVKAFAASLQSEGNYGGQTEGSNDFFQNAIFFLIFGIFLFCFQISVQNKSHF